MVQTIYKKIQITIDGNPIQTFSHMTVVQRSDWHHSFEIRCPISAIKGKNTYSAKSEAVMGKDIAVKVPYKALQEPSTIFLGVVTSLSVSRQHGGRNDVVIKGYSPTIKMDDGEHCRSFSEKTLKKIADEVVKSYGLSLKGKPNHSDNIPFFVQYKESNYHFLSRIASLYGEWFYYDGENLCFGAPDSGETIELMFGKHLFNFELKSRLAPQKFKWKSYDHVANEQREGLSSDVTAEGLGEFGDHALKASDDTYDQETLSPFDHDGALQKDLDHFVKAHKTSSTSDLVVFSGTSDMPSLKIGSIVSIGDNSDEDGDGRPDWDKIDLGSYIIVSIAHTFDGAGNYQNHFEAIPSGVAMPPLNSHIKEPYCELQPAVVKENDDPDKLGRVRVQMFWQDPKEMTPWIRIVTNHAGQGDEGSYGVYFVPEIGDEIYVGFEHDSPNKPYMMGSLYHGKKPPEWADPDNNQKAIKTRSGHTFLMNDEAGKESITILDKSGNTITLDTAGSSISISAPENMTLSCKNMTIDVGENMDITVGQNQTLSVGQDKTDDIGNALSITAGTSIDSSAGQSISGKAGQTVSLNAGMNMSMAAGIGIEQMAGTTMVVGAGKSINMNSGKTIASTAGKSIDMKASSGAGFELAAAGKAILKSKKKIQMDCDGKFDVNAKDKAVIGSKKIDIAGKSKTTVKGSKVEVR